MARTMQKIAEIVSGVAEGCVQSGAALIGSGETAEHPGLMPEKEYGQRGLQLVRSTKKIFLQEKN